MPDHAWRSEAEGSFLAWDEVTRVLTYNPPAQRPESGWAIQVGPGSRHAARVVRVRGSLPHGMTGFAVNRLDVDHLAFLAGNGSVLTPGLPTGAAEVFSGWYPPAAVRALAETSGLAYAEDTVIDWADLLTRYRGLVPGARWLSRSATASAVLYTAFGVLFLVSGLAGLVMAVAGERAGMVLAALGVPTGVFLLWAGLRFSYRFTRLWARRRGEGRNVPPMTSGAGGT